MKLGPDKTELNLTGMVSRQTELTRFLPLTLLILFYYPVISFGAIFYSLMRLSDNVSALKLYSVLSENPSPHCQTCSMVSESHGFYYTGQRFGCQGFCNSLLSGVTDKDLRRIQLKQAPSVKLFVGFP